MIVKRLLPITHHLRQCEWIANKVNEILSTEDLKSSVGILHGAFNK